MDGCTQWGTDVGVSATNVSRGRVVADGEEGSESGIDKPVGTGDSGTTDLSGTLPDDLGEVTKVVEVGQVNVVGVKGTWEVAELAVVHVVGDHDADLVGGITGTNVLSVATAIDSARIRLVIEVLQEVGQGSAEKTYTLCA